MPELLILIASAPPSANAIVSAAGKKIPVLVSPEVVIAGAAAEPAENVATPEALSVVTLAVPPDTLVAVVAVVALVAEVALPLNAAVIVPALKLPEASRATTVDAVLAVAIVWVLSLMILPVVPSNSATALAVADAGPDTSPPPEGVAQTPSPRQKVLPLADVPLFKFVTGKLPVTPVDSGKPVAFVKVTEVGVPSSGVTSVGEVDSTTSPVPVVL